MFQDAFCSLNNRKSIDANHFANFADAELTFSAKMSSKRTKQAKGRFSRDERRTEEMKSQVSSSYESRDSSQGDDLESGFGRGYGRGIGRGESRGRSTHVDREMLRGPTIPPPTLNWGPGRGRFAARSERIGSRGEAGHDAPSESKKRRNESSHAQECGSKAMKLYDSSSQKQLKPAWTSGGPELQNGRLDAITDANKVGGGQEKPNMVSQFVGPMMDAVASKTTAGFGKDAETCLLGAHKLAEARSRTGEVFSVHIPVRCNPDPTASTSGGRASQTPQEGPRRLRLTQHNHNPFASSRASSVASWSSSRASSPAPWTRASFQGDKDKKDKEGRVTEVVDDATKTSVVKPDDAQPVDLTVLDHATICEICRKTGSHATGRCAVVTSLVHGGTNTDPFCDISPSAFPSRSGQEKHVLQGPQKSTFNISCPVLDAHWANYELWVIWLKLVVERRRMPPLAVYTPDFCIMHMTLTVSGLRYGGKLPPEMDGICHTRKPTRSSTRRNVIDSGRLG